ncbi:flagellar hook-basal body complex protein [Paracoccaceae bacterium]|nr:flagellar hook-basal body complex protein [Paracoccaceae bacterium]
MSFYTALTGLKGAQTDIATTSNNIANVGSSGFKKSRAEFGDIFGSTPLQTNSIGAGTATKSIKQQFSQGNISQSTNTLDMAVSGQGFFVLKGGGNAGQTVFTRNGSFEVNDAGFIVDSNGQFLLGYPVDNDGAVADKTLQGATQMQLAATFGDPVETKKINAGVNLPSDAPVIAADVEFDANDAKTYSASSSVTIFDNGGNPKSATIFYIKSQNPSNEDPTFKYSTKMFVDGVEILPELTRATTAKSEPQFIDKFGQKTTVPTDPAYILEGKGTPLYRADDLGEATKSTPAMLTGLGLEAFLGDGKTIEIVTDPMQFKQTMEYQALQNIENPVPGTFWGKDFLLVDVDNSGPVSINIPPGTYTGTELAAATEVALRDAFGDDKMVQLTDDVDNTFTIDFKQESGDGKSEGLPSPITVDLHTASIVTEATGVAAEDGMKMDTFLSHAQRLMTNQLNAYIQDPADTDGVDATKVDNIGADGKLFKRMIANAKIDTPPEDFDVLTLDHTNPDVNGGAAVERYLGYSNVANEPRIKAYDNLFKQPAGGIGVGAAANEIEALDVDGDGYLRVTIKGVITDNLELFRFQQNDVTANGTSTDFIELIGSEEIAIKSFSNDGTDTVFILDQLVAGGALPAAAQDEIKILAKPSDHIEAFFESTEGLVEGVNEVFYSNKIVVREVGDSAKRNSADEAAAFANVASDGGVALTGYGFANASAFAETMNWVDERNPALKIGYDETNQRLTFDGVNSMLGKGTGVGFDTFTVYSKKLDSGKNGLGIPALGESPEISLKTDNLLLGNAFVNDGPEVRAENKRYGMEVEFDTVNNVFNISSGSTGEALAGGSVVGVDLAQNASSVAVGRYNLLNTGERDTTDTADYEAYKIGNGANQIMGFPREGIEGYRGPTGLLSKPAQAVGFEALMDMTQPFTVTTLANENIFNVVVGGVSASIVIPEGNYKGDTLAVALEERINSMKNPISGQPVGGVEVTYDADANNLTFTTATTGEGNTIAINGALKFGLKDIPLGLGETTEVRQPVQATDELGRPLYISPQGEIVANNQEFADNMVENFYPLYLDEGELTFDRDGQIVSPITEVTYSGDLTELTLDFSSATQLDQAFSAREVTQDGFSAGRLTNLEIDSYGNVRAGYSNGQNVTLGKIMLASFASESGLKQIGNSTFIATAASGDPELGEGAEDGFGQILSGSIERSNVDITEELVNLITSQRNYQAAAKAIETSTSMTQTIINIRS